MDIQTVIDHFGGPSKTARALGVTPQAVGFWKDKGKIPFTRQYQIQIVTDGKFKAIKPDPDQAA